MAVDRTARIRASGSVSELGQWIAFSNRLREAPLAPGAAAWFAYQSRTAHTDAGRAVACGQRSGVPPKQALRWPQMTDAPPRGVALLGEPADRTWW